MQRQSMLARQKRSSQLMLKFITTNITTGGEKAGRWRKKDTSVKRRGGKIKTGRGCWRRRGGGEEEERTHTHIHTRWRGREATADRCYCMWAPCEDRDASSTTLKAIRIPNAISEPSVRHQLKHARTHTHTNTLKTLSSCPGLLQQPEIIPYLLSLSSILCLLFSVHPLLLSLLSPGWATNQR